MKFKNKIIQEAYNNMIDNIYSIAKVECPTITRGQTQEIINKFDKVKEKYKEYEYWVVIDLTNAYRTVLKMINSDSGKIQARDALYLNKLIGEHTNGEKTGVWRDRNVRIHKVGYNPPFLPQTKFIERIEQVTKKRKITFEDIVKLQASICKMQMFNDCNKRTSLVFCNAIAIQNNIEYIKIVDQVKWIDLLLEYYDDEKNLEKYVNFIKSSSLEIFEK